MHRRSGPRRIRCGGTGDLAPACEDAPVNQPRSIYESRLAARRTRIDRAIDLYQRALARLDGNWADPRAENGARFLDPKHPYAADLDLFGPQSLFHLLCTARTSGGEAMLAAWLGAPAAPPEVRARQEAVRELRPRLDLREALWVAGQAVRAAIDHERQSSWGEAPSRLPWRRLPAP